MFKLVIADDEGKQTVVPLVRDEVTIGRKEGNTIRLTERNVSRRHARLLKANGKFVIEDLKSYNGVKVNGQRIGEETPLAAGDQITIGDYQLALQVEAMEAAGQASLAQADTAMLVAPGPPARLVMITPPSPGSEFPLDADKTRIGRLEDLDVWVNHQSISREHAEIQREPDGGLRLIDLGSANGVRVNGDDVQNALLEAGDVVELGQVQFRFVGAGEHYAFDADRTIQVDALVIEPESNNKTFVIAAAAILALALVAFVVVAFVGGGDDEGPVASEMTETTPADSASARYDTAIAACTSALEVNDVETALRHAQTALDERPDDPAAVRCQTQANQFEAQLVQFREGVAHLDEGEMEEAYFAFDSLPVDSPLRERPQVRRAIRGYATSQLRAGQAVLQRNASEAAQLANSVLAMHGITAEQQAEATQLLQDATARGASEESVAAAPRAAPRRPRTAAARRGRRRVASQPTTTAPVQAPSRPAAATGGGGGSTPRSRSGQNVDAQVRTCVMSGDNQCVIRLLEGRARTENQLAMLIAAYRARGQPQQARRYMQLYVNRFAGGRHASGYRRILAAQN